jgi:phosphoribosylamine--glycine ligase
MKQLPQTVNVLLLGSGGREHALAWKIAQSPRTAKLFIAPGNAGTASVGTNVDLQATNFGVLKQFVLLNNINLIVVGPEEPLVKGVADFVRGDSDIYRVQVIGPGADGARLEGSKAFAKAFMERHGVPTAAYRSFTAATIQEAFAFLEGLKAPYVLKADGLAAGKGVVIAQTLPEAQQELTEMLEGRFGAAGSTVVIEEYLQGIECSVFVATDGKSWKILPVAKDYKRIGEGDTGLNTGGMGAVSPVPFADAEFMRKVEQRIVRPTVEGLAAEGIDYCGFIFVGLMNVGGEPYVIEYNVRLGDPETEAVMPRIESDIVEMFEGMAFGTLEDYKLAVSPLTAVTVVCVAGGYPGDYRKGDEVTGLDGELVFQAGTAARAGKVLTNGGRVVAATALGDSLDAARAAAYEKAEKVTFEDKYFRRDIGLDLK